MTTVAVTADLLHALVTGSHAQGVTVLAVQAVISHHDTILLIAEPGTDFIDHTWRLPDAEVLPGQSLTDALDPMAATLGMSIEEVTGYLGHHDAATGQHLVRTFRFAVTVTDPDAICRSATIGHSWAHPDDLPADPRLPDQRSRGTLQPAASSPAATEPPPSGPLRARARGSYPDEAAVELLIAHAAFLHRSDFTDRFLDPGACHHPDPAMADIDWPAAITALEAGDLPCSRSEERILRLAASLGTGLPVDLRDATTGLDTRSAALFNQAVLHATGHQPAIRNH